MVISRGRSQWLQHYATSPAEQFNDLSQEKFACNNKKRDTWNRPRSEWPA